MGAAKFNTSARLLAVLIPNGEGRKAKPPLDHLQNRGVIVLIVRDEIALCIGRNNDTRNPEAEAAVGVARSSRCRWNRRQWWRNVLEEPAPFIEVDNQDRLRPIRAAGYRIVNLIEENFAVADVGVRMIVARRAAVLVFEAWIDVGDVRECAILSVDQELRERFGDS